MPPAPRSTPIKKAAKKIAVKVPAKVPAKQAPVKQAPIKTAKGGGIFARAVRSFGLLR